MLWRNRSGKARIALTGTLTVLLLCACGAIASLFDDSAGEATPTAVAQARAIGAPEDIPAGPSDTPRPATETPTPLTPTPTPTSAFTQTPAPTAVPTETPTATVMLRPTATPTPAPAPTLTFTPTVTPSPTGTATAAPTATPPPTVTPASTLTPAPFASMVEAQVVEAVNGDTIKVSFQGQTYSVRYIGIDAPETSHPQVGEERMAPEALAAKAALVEGQTVYLESDVSRADRYGRLLAYVYLADGRMVNEELVRSGHAESQTYQLDTRHQARLEAAEAEASAAGIGIWAPRPTVQPAGARIVITEYRGGGKPEYIGITNEGDADADLTGWWLLSVRGNQVYQFPAGFVLTAGATVRIYSGEGAVASPADGLLWTTENMWNNRESDPAELYNAAGELVSERER